MFIVGAVDKDKVANGSWFEVDGQRFLVARHDNHRYQEALEALRKPHKRAFDKGEVSAGVVTDIICKAMARALLLDWDGVTDPAGNAVPYTHDAGYQLLRDSPEFRELIAGFAREESAFFAEPASA